MINQVGVEPAAAAAYLGSMNASASEIFALLQNTTNVLNTLSASGQGAVANAQGEHALRADHINKELADVLQMISQITKSAADTTVEHDLSAASRLR